MKRNQGFTLIELLVVIAIIALLIGLLLPALAKAQQNARTMKDMTQQQQIHQAFLSYAQTDGKGKLPIPGLINRQAPNFPNGGGPGQLPGVGPEDHSKNTTQALYSSMIAQRYFGTTILIGPTEANPIVVEDLDYDFAQYNPANDSYWDDAFHCHIWARPGQGFFCNTSYAHAAICGDRKNLKWRDSQDSTYPILGTRGVEMGKLPGDPRHDRSPTLLLHGHKRQWAGNVVFADNHVDRLINFFPAQTTYEPVSGTGGPVKDNIFVAEFEHPEGNKAAPDAWLVISIFASSSGNWVLDQHDPL